MEKEKRQQAVLDIIKQTSTPISASKLGQMLNVSRQLIVGDIAILRAGGEKIFATPRGYLMEQPKHDELEFKIACIHDEERMEEELNIMIDEGAEVMDVIISHPIYGELKGNLHLMTRYDVREFIKSRASQQAPLLSNLSNGVHLHTIKCKDTMTVTRIIEHLRQAKLLYEE